MQETLELVVFSCENIMGSALYDLVEDTDFVDKESSIEDRQTFGFSDGISSGNTQATICPYTHRNHDKCS